MRYDYDMLGNRIHQASMEAGERWMLNDVAGKPIRAWDSRGFMRRMTYDELRRPTGLFVHGRTASSGWPSARSTAKARATAEQPPDARAIRSSTARASSPAKPTTSRATCCDSQRDLLPTTKARWTGSRIPTPNDGTFTSSTTYDALNRPTHRHHAGRQRLSPDLQRGQPARQGGREPARRGDGHALRHQHRLQRQGPARRSSTTATAPRRPTTYDTLTFRLTHLKTTRAPVRTVWPRRSSRRGNRAGSALHLRPGRQHHPHRGRCAARPSSTTTSRSSRSATTPTTPSTA